MLRACSAASEAAAEISVTCIDSRSDPNEAAKFGYQNGTSDWSNFFAGFIAGCSTQARNGG
jgi:hypothetical protein